MNIQSAYSAGMGYVLSTMLWKTSKTSAAIETYIEIGILNEFLNLVSVTIKSFRETYEDELPLPDSFEYKFLVSLFGICINILAQRVGRDYVLERDTGKEFIRYSITYLGKVPMPDGQLIKRLILMMMYNVSIAKSGALLIVEVDECTRSIFNCIDEHHTMEIRTMALTLINLLVEESPTAKFYNEVKNESQFIRQFVSNQSENNQDESFKELCNTLMVKIDDTENNANI
jgi:hypothetical protein